MGEEERRLPTRKQKGQRRTHQADVMTVENGII